MRERQLPQRSCQSGLACELLTTHTCSACPQTLSMLPPSLMGMHTIPVQFNMMSLLIVLVIPEAVEVLLNMWMSRNRYCSIHSASCVVKCVKSGKWFCNGRVTGSASCILTHLVSLHSSAATDRQRAGPCTFNQSWPVFRL